MNNRLFLLIFTTLIISTINALSKHDQKVIVDCHNNYRSQLANGKVQNHTGNMPQGANIKQLSYSKEVEASAAKWAEKCTISHSHGNYGENLFMSSNPKTKTADALTYACNAWWAEVKNIGIQGNLIMDRSLPGNGHATQMAWATTTQIGCALARCPASKWKTYLVCQYNPYGNVIGRTIYEKGKPCSGCGNNKCNSNGLCK
ncbi:unnamed protein product [Meloidogyne enterolobii]|uniref:Uncharacterized protein n=1 Tax=Meloidogyne enterolobii TaxID=390850 RepID=A0ACB0YIC7_MELEN